MSDLSPQAKALLRAARSFDEPSDEDHRRVRSSVLSRVGAGAAIGLAASMSTSTLAASTGTLLSGTVAKIGIAVLLAGGISTGAYFATRSHSAPVAAVIDNVKPAPLPAPARPEPVAPVQAQAMVDDSSKVEDSPTPPAGRSAAKARAPKVAGDIEGEVHLLEDADAALRRGDGAGALVKLNEHASKFPGGALRQEREGMTVVALCQAGRQAEGRAAAERFLSRSSKSALASRIRAACGIARAE
jgi:hypothetical protein